MSPELPALSYTLPEKMGKQRGALDFWSRAPLPLPEPGAFLLPTYRAYDEDVHSAVDPFSHLCKTAVPAVAASLEPPA